MALRIRCPHCREIVEVDDAHTGTPTTCMNCGGGFKVPERPSPAIPAAPSIPPARLVSACPRCRADIAPGTLVCPRCLTDVRSGKRLSFTERAKRLSVKTWVVTLLSLVGVAVVTASLIEWRRLHRPEPIVGDIHAAPTANEPREVTAARDLLNARDAAARRTAVDALLRIGEAAYPTLAAALTRLGRPGADPQATRTLIAAIDLLARSGDRRYLDSIRPLAEFEPLRSAVLRARGMLGDLDAAPEVVAAWTRQLRRRLFFDRLADVSPPSDQALTAIVVRERREYERWAEAVRRLSVVDDSRIVESMLDSYWDSWNWLGQPRDERFVAELWEAAKPPTDQDLQFHHRIRAARRVLDRTSRSGSASARAAAGLVLRQAGPQFEALRKEIIDAIAAGLGAGTPLEQQRGVWALGRLAAQNFRGLAPDSSPSDVTGETVAAAVEWSRSVGVGGAAVSVPPAAAYVPPPLIARRVITPRRQLERALLSDLERDWPSAARAVAEWEAAGLGFTPGIAGLLDARQRAPRYSALVGAMCVAVSCNARAAEADLRLWTESSDQPGWVRGLAYTAIAALEARAGRPTPGWPGGLTNDMLGDLDLGPPGLGPWAELVALGGEKMLNTLRADELAISETARSRLVAAAEQALRRRTAAANARAPEP
ncbi:MAG: hypothetical protein AMXMBFR47_09680 [Planctomycetota bacterium]